MEIVELIPEQTVTGDGNPGADTGETDPGDSSGDSSGTGENGGQL